MAAAIFTSQEPETPAEFCCDNTLLADCGTSVWQAGCTPKILETVDAKASACLCSRHAPVTFSTLCQPCPPAGGASTHEEGLLDSFAFESNSTDVEFGSVGAAPRFIRDRYADMERDLEDPDSSVFGDSPRFKATSDAQNLQQALAALPGGG